LKASKLNEINRLEKLRSLCLLDTPIDPAFDRLTRLARNILKTPISLVSLVDEDRQFFKSFIGLPEPWATTRETPLSHSFCKHVVTTGEPLIITDARLEPLVQDNLAIEDLGVIAYAGMPLITSDGYELGSFCAIDTQPKQWTAEEISILADLTASVMTEIELRSELEHSQQLEAQLVKNEERYRLLSELMSDYAFSTQLNLTGELQLDWITEDAFKRLTGYTLPEVLARPKGSIMLDEYIEKAHEDAKAALAGETRSEQYQIQTKQGELRWLQVDRYPRWNDNQDRIIGFYGIARDVTEERLTQQKKRELVAEQERTRALQAFVSDVSHDFRTPLSIVKTNLYLLKQVIPSDQHNRLHLIADQTTRLDTLISSLLLMSRLGNTNEWSFSSININNVLHDIQIEFAPKAMDKTIELIWQLDESLPATYADPNYLYMAIKHLVENALQFTPASGQILIRTHSEADYTILEVEDTGIGISEEDLPHIFDRFYRADEARSTTGGSGMGLAIVKQIVDAHKGMIEAESVVHQGSLIRLHFPKGTFQNNHLTENLYQLIYISTAIKDMFEIDLLELLIQSRHNNKKSDITGLLLYHNGHFLQVLEGIDFNVKDIFQKIQQDSRHTDVSVVVTQYIDKREFGDWEMGFVNLETLNPDEVQGYSDFLQKPMSQDTFTDNPVLAQNYLGAFRNFVQ
jgi:PAS domain S-box-containing protein